MSRRPTWSGPKKTTHFNYSTLMQFAVFWLICTMRDLQICSFGMTKNKCLYIMLQYDQTLLNFTVSNEIHEVPVEFSV